MKNSFANRQDIDGLNNVFCVRDGKESKMSVFTQFDTSFGDGFFSGAEHHDFFGGADHDGGIVGSELVHEHGGGLSGNALFSIRYPYLIQTRYNARYASNYKHLIGIPAKSFHYLKDLIGYTEIESVVIDSLTHCTKDEKDAIINMLKEGVYL